MNQQHPNTKPEQGHDIPWYRQFWPWFIIALPTAAVVASFFTLWLAISQPDYMVVDDDEYQQLNSGLKAQVPAEDTQQDISDDSGLRPD